MILYVEQMEKHMTTSARLNVQMQHLQQEDAVLAMKSLTLYVEQMAKHMKTSVRLNVQKLKL